MHSYVCDAPENADPTWIIWSYITGIVVSYNPILAK